MKASRKFTQNIFYLSASGLFLRGIGLLFTSYLTKATSNEALGLFSLVNSVYAVSVTIACAGINLAVTRIISEEITDKINSARGAMRQAFFIATVTGLLAFFTLILISRPACAILGDERIMLPLFILSPSILFLSLTNVQSGYFTAVRRIKKSIVVSIFDELLRITLSVIAVHFTEKTPGAICIALALVSTVAEFISFVIFHFIYIRDFKKSGFSRKNDGKSNFKKKILSISLPVAASSVLRSGISTLRSLIVPKALISFGLTRKAALSELAFIGSMAMPIIMFPSTIVYSFAGLIVPELSEMKKLEKSDKIKNVLDTAFENVFRYSFLVFSILCVFGKEIGYLFYKSGEAGFYLTILSPLVLTVYIDAAVDGMLKGLNEQTYSMMLNLAEAVISLTLTFFLLPKIGIKGYIITLYICEIFNTVISARRLIKVTGYEENLMAKSLKPFLFGIFSCIFAKHIIGFMFSFQSVFFPLLISLPLACFIYFLLYRFSKKAAAAVL